MTVEEMDDMFEVLYNNITSNQAPGLNAYEKSVFLTKAQDEIVKNYFNPKSKGNLTQEGFDDNPKRQIDFSKIMTVYATLFNQESSKGSTLFSEQDNAVNTVLPDDVMMMVNEVLTVARNGKNIALQVIPLRFDEYTRLMSKPYKRPLKYQAWRINNYSYKNSDQPDKNMVEFAIGPNDTAVSYTVRYIRKPKPIIVSDLDGLTIDTLSSKSECELDPILHEEILQRAVELAKAAWTSTGQDNIQAVIQAGQRSE